MCKVKSYIYNFSITLDDYFQQANRNIKQMQTQKQARTDILW